jgi:hypothetical protein
VRLFDDQARGNVVEESVQAGGAWHSRALGFGRELGAHALVILCVMAWWAASRTWAAMRGPSSHRQIGHSRKADMGVSDGG